MAEFDAIVVGLGGIGSAAACWLARRGLRVLGLERFEFGHPRGASQDHSRIIRRSYHTRGYVELAGRAYEAWAAIEAESGERLVVRTGGLDLWPEGAAIPMEDYAGSLSAAGVPFEAMDGGEVMRRWPAWKLPEGTRAILQEDGGFLAAARCNDVHRRLAVDAGAVLRERCPVARIEATGDEVTVEADGGRHHAGRVIVAADAWTNELLRPLGRTLPLAVLREQVTYYGSPDPATFGPERFPVWIWMDEPSFYGVPVFGEPGPKVGQDCGGSPVSPDARSFAPDPEESARVDAFVARHLPGALGPPVSVRTCLYTLTPDRDFVLDALPEHPEVLVALGAAHGFKFASLFGRALADLVATGRTDLDLEPFRIDRPILLVPRPTTSWMI